MTARGVAFSDQVLQRLALVRARRAQLDHHPAGLDGQAGPRGEIGQRAAQPVQGRRRARRCGGCAPRARRPCPRSRCPRAPRPRPAPAAAPAGRAATPGGGGGEVSVPASHRCRPYWPSTMTPGTWSRPPSSTAAARRAAGDHGQRPGQRRPAGAAPRPRRDAGARRRGRPRSGPACRRSPGRSAPGPAPAAARPGRPGPPRCAALAGRHGPLHPSVPRSAYVGSAGG